MKIKALRIFPPLAFARFGSASEPQPNYELENPDALGFRRIIPGENLIVAKDGTLTVEPPPDPAHMTAEGIAAMFRHGDQIRPVAPFFELRVLTDKHSDEFVPLTLELMRETKIDPAAVSWSVHVENRKVFRRTGDENDIVKAEITGLSGHEPQPLSGIGGYFVDGASIEFGSVQFVKPDARDGIYSQFRLRFTPGPGRIYGPYGRRTDGTARDDDSYVTRVYNGGNWPRFTEKKPGKDSNSNSPRQTLPTSLYANKAMTPPWLNAEEAISRGYLDDACDGFIFVSMERPDDKPLIAGARICAGPPSFVPDSQFVRTLADDLDQIVNGLTARDLDVAEAQRRSLDIVRRAYETVRFMNVAVMNGNTVGGRPAAAFDTMAAEESFATERPVRPIMSMANVDTAAVLALHEQVFAALSAGAAPWFHRLLRKGDAVGDLTDRGRRKMPALMSGADSLHLALTDRQVDTIARATQPPAERLELEPRNRSALLRIGPQLNPKVAGNPVNSRLDMAVANCCPGLEVDFRAVWRRLFEGIEFSEHENYVVADTRVDADGKPAEPNLKGHRLLGFRVDENSLFTNVFVKLQGPSSADPGNPDKKATLRSDGNPNGIWTKEWSNLLAGVVGKKAVQCLFTAAVTEVPVGADNETELLSVWLPIRDFFYPDSAVISMQLALPGELTQGLCSPWQNDLRECSCYYWASSRPDFVNTYVGQDGLSHGDNWFARVRTGSYVPDDYADTRLIGYEELFKDWEKKLQFQIGGKDSVPPKPDSPAATPRKI
jgi:hypothetical protein